VSKSDPSFFGDVLTVPPPMFSEDLARNIAANRLVLLPAAKHTANTFTFGSNVSSRDLHDIHHAKPPQLANLPCGPILVREPLAKKLVIFSTRRVGKNRNARGDAALHEVCRFERPPRPEAADTTMTSTGAIGSLTTSAHPEGREDRPNC
jgi:hypothetical protein